MARLLDSDENHQDRQRLGMALDEGILLRKIIVTEIFHSRNILGIGAGVWLHWIDGYIAPKPNVVRSITRRYVLSR